MFAFVEHWMFFVVPELRNAGAGVPVPGNANTRPLSLKFSSFEGLVSYKQVSHKKTCDKTHNISRFVFEVFYCRFDGWMFIIQGYALIYSTTCNELSCVKIRMIIRTKNPLAFIFWLSLSKFLQPFSVNKAKNIALFPAHRVTKINLKNNFFGTSLKKNIVENLLFYFSGSQ